VLKRSLIYLGEVRNKISLKNKVVNEVYGRINGEEDDE
jgi:hypothetical protein